MVVVDMHAILESTCIGEKRIISRGKRVNEE